MRAEQLGPGRLICKCSRKRRKQEKRMASKGMRQAYRRYGEDAPTKRAYSGWYD